MWTFVTVGVEWYFRFLTRRCGCVLSVHVVVCMSQDCQWTWDSQRKLVSCHVYLVKSAPMYETVLKHDSQSMICTIRKCVVCQVLSGLSVVSGTTCQILPHNMRYTANLTLDAAKTAVYCFMSNGDKRSLFIADIGICDVSRKFR